MDARLIVVRGPSGAGKSSVVEGIRAAYGRGVAWIEQDHVRRTVFQEKDEPGGANIAAISQLAGLAMSRGFHTVVEGIMPTVRYGEMLGDLVGRYGGSAYVYYLDVPFDETVRRHATRAKASAFDAAAMREWYGGHDPLGLPGEVVIEADSTLDETVRRILTETGLVAAAG
ncbi:AAA domain-containing protein [Kribbella voronezhensis]|uniref:AAA domain-containing protein n=1 Tax=Kribbella voronezhensis TaxID=2512212 RepID=A0A4R7TE31_9ACTN|nr:AAA family ATPase [Kribbella voronezhensis]TDU90421.1 AAA domain-containing protein [Kribbella voronezhensis]